MTNDSLVATSRPAGGSAPLLVPARARHASTLAAWSVAFWFAVRALIGAAVLIEWCGPTWWRALAPAAATCQVVALAWFFVERQWATRSETGAFRLGVTLVLAVVGVIAWELRRGRPRFPTCRPGLTLRNVERSLVRRFIS